jgi:T1SS-143 domain-containing protein
MTTPTTVLVTVDESSGIQNDTQGTVTSNDYDLTAFGATPLPSLFVSALSSEGASASSAQNVAVSGATGGTSTSSVLTFGADTTDVSFTDGSGNPLSDVDSGLKTTDGTTIYLYTSSYDNNVVVGRAGGSSGDVVFAVYMDTGVDTGSGDPGATSAKIWLVQFESMQHDNPNDPNDIVYLQGLLNVSVTSPIEFSLAGAPSGQNLFLMFGDGTPSTDDVTIVVTGKNPADQSAGESITTGDTVNTGQGGGTTTIGSNNQMIDPSEGMYFTFVKGADPDLTVPNLDQNEADVEANIDFTNLFGTTAASFAVVQLQPPKGATLKVSAMLASVASDGGTATDVSDDTPYAGVDYVDHLNTNALVDIDSVTITRTVKVGKNLVPTDYSFSEITNVSQAGLTLNFNGDTVTIQGVQAGDRVSYHTVSEHDRVLVDNIGNSNAQLNAAVDIGNFRVESGTTTTNPLDALAFVDDAPTAGGTAQTNTVDEDGLTGGIAGGPGDVTVDNDDGDNNEATSAGNVAAIFDGGADGLASYGMATDTTGLDATLTSQGGAVLYDVTGDTLTAYVDDGTNTGYQSGEDRAVFALVLDPTTGGYTFTLMDQLDHPLTDDPGTLAVETSFEDNIALDLGSVLTATDGDGDTVTAAGEKLVVTVNDDSPTTFTPDGATLTNNGTDSDTEALNDANSVGADQPGTIVFVDNYVNDDYLRDSNGALLTSGGENIVLTGFGTGTLTATTESSLTTVFTATLDDPSAHQYTITFGATIDDGGGINFLGAAPVKSGNPTFNLINDVDGTTLDLLFSGGDVSGGSPTAHSVNVSTTGAGTDNQSMNPTEMLRIDFAIGASLAGSPLGSDFNLGTHKTVNGYSFMVSQNTPSGTTGTTFIQAFDADSDKILVGDSGDVVDPLTKVLVNGLTLWDGTTVTDQTVNGHLVHAIVYNNGVVITGLNEGATGDGTGGDDPIVKVYTADGFNRIEVSNYAGQVVNSQTLGGTSFDIAPAGVDQAVQGNTFNFDMAVQQTDYDGDTGPVELIGVTVDPVPIV